jgi:magnesium-transporting ATPase (P-type)
MNVQEIRTASGTHRLPAAAPPPPVQDLLRAAVLAASGNGDAIEAALVRAAEEAGVDVEDERLFNPRLDTLQGGGTPVVATLHLHVAEGQAIYLHGAPEPVVERCVGWAGSDWPLDREAVLAEVLEMTSAGLRVVAVAGRVPTRPLPRLTPEEVADGCLLYGLVGVVPSAIA